jgi:nucleoside phosphorylase
MFSQQQTLLRQFDEGLRPEIVEFGKRIRRVSGEVDVVIFMARKAACFAEALRLVRLTAYQCVTTSNRVLDMNPSWFSGKSVAIIDDALITGTELYRTIQKVRPYAKSVEVHVLAVNKNWNAELVKPASRYLELDDEECALACANIVDAISLIPLPYSTDYPLYSGFRVKREHLRTIAHLDSWRCIDVTSSLQSQYSVFSKTICPEESTLEQINSRLGADLSRNALIKFRLYGRFFDKGRTTVWCNATPIVAFESLSKSVVDDLFSCAAQSYSLPDHCLDLFAVPDPAIQDTKDARYKAKLRFVQHLAASEIAQLWQENAEQAINQKLHFKPDELSLGMLFPQPLCAELIKRKHGPKPFAGVNLPTSRPKQPHLLRSFEPSKPSSSDAWAIETHLIGPFVRLYRELELPARRLAQKYGEKIFTDPGISKQHSKLRDRLQNGFGLQHLRNWLCDADLNKALREKILSLFLDRAIDLGAVVPITCVSGNAVFRAYRHGEDILFGEEELRLATVLLRSMFQTRKAAGRKFVSQIEVEKALVLFVRIGLEKQILRRPEKAVLGERGTAGIRFSLHGAVVGVETDKLYTVDSDSSATAVLERAGVLERVDPRREWKGDRPYVVKGELISTDADIQRKATPQVKNLGMVLGELRNRGRNQRAPGQLTLNELILIASCATARDTTGALSAEVKIVDKLLRGLRERCLGFPFTDRTRTVAASLAVELRDSERNYVPVAIHSACWKHDAFISRRPWEIIRRIESSLSDSRSFTDEMLKNLWTEYWPKSLDQNPVKHPLSPLISQLAGWIYGIKSHYLLIEVALLNHSAGGKHAKCDALLNESQSAFSKHAKLTNRMATSGHIPAELVREQVSEGKCDPAIVCKTACRRIAELLEESSDLLRQVDISASPYGHVKNILRFKHVLAIRMSSTPSAKDALTESIRGFIRQSLASYAKEFKDDLSIHLLPQGEFMGSMAAVIVGYANRELNSMAKLAAELVSRFANKCDLGVTLLWDLPDHFCPLCEDGTNEYFGRLFGEVCRTIENAVAPVTGSFLRTVGPKEFQAAGILAPHVKTRFEQVFVPNGHDTLAKLAESSLHHVVSEVFSLHPNFIMLNAPPTVDVGILAVVGDESRAITTHLTELPGFRDFGDYTSDKTVRPFFMGSLPAKSGGVHRIAGVQANKQGNTSIMAAYQDLYDEFRPTLIVLIGIGGSISKELVENDVCLANAVVNYDSRSATETGIKHTLDPLPPIEPWLMEIWRALERKYGEDFELKSASGKNFKVRLGPIGSGGAVVKDESSEIRSWLLTVCRKSTAVETEAVGVAEQFSQNKLKHNHATRGYLVIRGISDSANKDKDRLYREACVRNAMIFLQEFLAQTNAGFTNVLPRIA